jgi:hypothetical protein
MTRLPLVATNGPHCTHGCGLWQQLEQPLEQRPVNIAPLTTVQTVADVVEGQSHSRQQQRPQARSPLLAMNLVSARVEVIAQSI